MTAIQQQIRTLFQQLKTEWEKPDNVKNLDKMVELIEKLKIEFFKSDPPSVTEKEPDLEVVETQRDTLEIGVLVAVLRRDKQSFQRGMAQLKHCYNEVGKRKNLPESQNKYELLGLNLMHLLASKRIPEFQAEIGRIPNDVARKCDYISMPIQLEQYLKKGMHNKIFLSKLELPSPYYSYFVEILLDTVTLIEFVAILAKDGTIIACSKDPARVYRKILDSAGWLKIVGNQEEFRTAVVHQKRVAAARKSNLQVVVVETARTNLTSAMLRDEIEKIWKEVDETYATFFEYDDEGAFKTRLTSLLNEYPVDVGGRSKELCPPGSGQCGTIDEETDEPQIRTLFQQLKTEWEKPDNAKNLVKVEELIEKLKIEFLSSDFMPVSGKEPNLDLLVMQRDTLEIGALVAVLKRDKQGFQRAMAQVKHYYNEKITECIEVGIADQILNLMHLLAEKMLPEFHMELECIPSQVVMDNIYISTPVQLEQFMMIGTYNKVFLSKSNVPSPYYSYFVEILLDTVRDEIADCIAKSQKRLSVNETARMLFFDVKSGAQDVLTYAKKKGWQQTDDKSAFIFSSKQDRKSDEHSLDSDRLVQHYISYAKQLDTII